jgi:hypothetical protein
MNTTLKKVLTIILAMMTILNLVGCSNRDNETTEEVDESNLTELGVGLTELKKNMTQFIINTYMPSEDATKDDYLQPIMKYLSEIEYENLTDDIGEYNADLKTSVKSLSVKYSLGENNSDNIDKVLCQFYLLRSQGDITIRNKIDLVFNIQGNQIVSHSIYTGNTEVLSN